MGRFGSTIADIADVCDCLAQDADNNVQPELIR